MKLTFIRPITLVTSIAILVAGCENMTPGENAAVFGSGAGILAGSLARAAGASTGESIAIGAATGAVVAMTTYIIAKRRATEKQRQIAQQRAAPGQHESSLGPRPERSDVVRRGWACAAGGAHRFRRQLPLKTAFVPRRGGRSRPPP